MFVMHIQFQDPISNGSRPYPSVTDGRTDQTAASDQGLHCLHIRISIQIKIKIKTCTGHILLTCT